MGDNDKNMVRREDFGGTEMQEAGGANIGKAIAARETAQIQAGYVIAMQRPRDLSVVRDSLLADCRRPGFAEIARFKKPMGKDRDGAERKPIVGWSVRFAEAALRALRNMRVDVTLESETMTERVLRVAVVDRESNTDSCMSVVIRKVAEQSYLKKGQTALSQRVNDAGQNVYLVEATDDKVLMMQNALVSKARRNGILSMLPGDIADDCLNEIKKTLAAEDKKDPTAAKKKLADAFSEMGVKPDALAAYLGHPLDVTTPAELADLRAIYAALKDGETTWAAVLEDSKPGETTKPSDPSAPPTSLSEVAAKAKTKGKKEKAPETPPVVQGEIVEPAPAKTEEKKSDAPPLVLGNDDPLVKNW